MIALRASLRVLPFIATSNDESIKKFALLPFRSNLKNWSQIIYSSIYTDAEEHDAYWSFRNSSSDYHAYQYQLTASSAGSYNSAELHSKLNNTAGSLSGFVSYAVNAFDTGSEWRAASPGSSNSANGIYWKSVQDDCQRLGSFQGTTSAESLAVERLWDKSPASWSHIRSDLVRKLNVIDPNYSVWTEWYDRRIRGERAAFDIPGDQNRAEDKAILFRLARATNEDFWDKGHEYVNATLKGWLDEARARVALPTIIAEAFGTFDITGVSKAELGLLLPPQNRNAISFKQDEAGRIAIDAGASADQLCNNADARDRHAEAISEARALLNRCNGNNAAARLTQRLENYLDAAGTSVDDIKPSLIVQRGERLRQELAAYAVPGTLLDPIADDILIDLKGWQSAHNMLVGLDPVLMAIDTSMIGPDRRPEMMSPDEIKQFVHDAQVKGLLADGTEAILIETADLASAVPGANDRRANASIEMVRNLCIETVSIALNHPIGTAAFVAICVAASSSITSGAISGVSIMGSIKAAEYLINHRPWIEGKFGNTPTWQALFAKIADWLEKNTPFQPK